MWDPTQYEVYADERARPFHELIARVGAPEPQRVVDLGCGDGTLTATLLSRWPDAVVHGVDSSAEMLQAARSREMPGRLSFELGDLVRWRPRQPVDVIVSNAALHWVPNHVVLLDRLVAELAADGWLAFQVPGNFDAPTHTELHALCLSSRWKALLGQVALDTRSVLSPGSYLARLAGLGCRVDAWETTYQHVLPGADPVLEWVRGTALRPVLAALGEGRDAGAFIDQYAARLRAAYPTAPYGTVLPFRRIFVVAHRPA